MPTLPLPKPGTEPPRPQRRHYLEVGVSNDLNEDPPCISDETSKILIRDPSAPVGGPTGRSTYQHDFRDGVEMKEGGKVLRMVRPKVRGVPGLEAPVGEDDRKRMNYQRSLRDGTYSRDAASPALPSRERGREDAREWEDPKWREERQKEMDKYLYMSQYQGAYDLEKNGTLPYLRTHSQNTSRSHSPTPHHHQPAHNPQANGTGHVVTPPKDPHDTGLSLYQNSFLNPKIVNGNLLEKGVSAYGKSKLLYVPREPGTGVRDLLHIENSPKTYSRTSYKTDYMLCPPIESLIEQQQQGPALPMTNPSSLRTVVPKAFKYRRWGGWAGAV
ncbi:hypothetical protein HK097_006180 [Rhizophlyctis rosea]|uniref:Uncharacterized protein n=1 Tax=Rhizophlyctis rosea TaxID=64517 RepID=A0AAD5X894_9FUNG|nr:hypothetical protein HK097_006180 [Rhizophlyctis rosea]